MFYKDKLLNIGSKYLGNCKIFISISEQNVSTF